MIEITEQKLNHIKDFVGYGIDWMGAAEEALTPNIFDMSLNNGVKCFNEAINSLPDCVEKEMYRMMLAMNLTAINLIKKHSIKRW